MIEDVKAKMEMGKCNLENSMLQWNTKDKNNISDIMISIITLFWIYRR
jgi:hypothetical protein